MTEDSTTIPAGTAGVAGGGGAGEVRTRTAAERHASVIDLLHTLAPAADPAAFAGSMERRHGALGTFAMDAVYGDLWSRPQLGRRDRSLLVLTYLTVLGADDELRFHVRGALNHGLTRSEIEEIVLQVAAYAGFPMALASARVIDATFAQIDGKQRLAPRDPAVIKDDVDRRADAAEVLTKLSGGRSAADPAAARAAVVARLGGVGELVFDWGFGELWSRPELSRRDRSLVTLAILSILRCHEEYRTHVPGALQHGCTPTEIEEVAVQLVMYGGFPRSVEAMRELRAALAKAAGASPTSG